MKLSLGYPIGGYYQLQLSTTKLHERLRADDSLPNRPWHDGLWDPPALCELLPGKIRIVSQEEAKRRWAAQHRLLGPCIRSLLAARRRADLVDQPKPPYRPGVHYGWAWMP